MEIVKNLNTSNAGAVVLSMCVQMLSLAAVQKIRDRIDLPMLTAATVKV
ncbi:hypothetical protein [Geobacillus thermoleovorans]